MTDEARLEGEKRVKAEAPGLKRPSNERDPLARDVRGTARREEIRARAPRLVPPRQSQHPMERSRQPRAHTR